LPSVLFALFALFLGAIFLLSGKAYGIICLAASIAFIPKLNIIIYRSLMQKIWIIRLLSALAVIACLSFAVINEFVGYFEWSSKLEGMPADSFFRKTDGIE
jgi:hypothetical protein